MKKAIALFLTLTLALSLFTACGKEPAPAETQEAPAATTLPQVEEVTEPVETTAETTVETEPPTEPGPTPSEIIIGSEIYTFPLYAANLVNNGWEIDCYSTTFEEVNSTHVSFERDGFGFNADIRGTIGGSVYDSDVIITAAFFYSSENAAFAAVAGSIYPGMASEDVMPTLESIGYEEIESFENGDGYIICAYHGDYSIEIHCSPDQVDAIIVVN